MIPQLERALIAGHDVVLLGERGQGKTRLLRTLVGLLDEWTPVIAGSDLGEHPYEPVSPESRRRAAELGDDLPVSWRHRDERYAEKLATPDTSVADLIGDVDPMKVAEGRTLGDPETIHFGLIPRSHRGIVAINELPDLAERIQVAMLNVMEERDIQIRGYVLRLPLDVLVVASANPEDYTNRGRIITPLKDRFGAEIRTHYPRELEDEIAVIRQEAHLVADVPRTSSRSWPASPATCASPARSTSAPACPRGSRSPAPRPSPPRRCTARPARARPSRSPGWSTSRPPSTCSAARSSSRPARRAASARCSTTCSARPRPRRSATTSAASTSRCSSTRSRTAPWSPPASRSPPATSSPGCRCWASPSCTTTSATGSDATNDGQRASAIELALEGLYLARKISKDTDGAETVYG